MYLLLKMVLFHCHVTSLPECKTASPKTWPSKRMGYSKNSNKIHWGPFPKKRWDSPRQTWINLWNLGEKCRCDYKKTTQPASVVSEVPGVKFFTKKHPGSRWATNLFLFKMFKFWLQSSKLPHTCKSRNRHPPSLGSHRNKMRMDPAGDLSTLKYIGFCSWTTK